MELIELVGANALSLLSIAVALFAFTVIFGMVAAEKRNYMIVAEALEQRVREVQAMGYPPGVDLCHMWQSKRAARRWAAKNLLDTAHVLGWVMILVAALAFFSLVLPNIATMPWVGLCVFGLPIITCFGGGIRLLTVKGA